MAFELYTRRMRQDVRDVPYLSKFHGARADVLKFSFFVVVSLLSLQQVIKPLCQGGGQGFLPTELAFIRNYPCTASGAQRAAYIYRQAHKAYPIFYQLPRRDGWVPMMHVLLLLRLGAAAPLPPAVYAHNFAPLLTICQRLCPGVFLLVLSLTSPSEEPSALGLWYLRAAPLLDVISLGFFKCGFCWESLYSLTSMAAVAWLCTRYARLAPHLDLRLPQMLASQAASAVVLLAFETWRVRAKRRAEHPDRSTKRPTGSCEAAKKQQPAPPAVVGGGGCGDYCDGGGGEQEVGCGGGRTPAVRTLRSSAAGMPPSVTSEGGGPSPAVEAVAAAPDAAEAAAAAAAEPGAQVVGSGDPAPSCGPEVATATAGGPGATDDMPPEGAAAEGQQGARRSEGPMPSDPSFKGAGAGADVGAVAGAGAARPPGRRYRPRVRLISTAIKISGADPDDLGPGYEQRIMRLLAARGLEMEGVYVRRGCIEVVVDARAWARARSRQITSGPDPAPPSGGLQSASVHSLDEQATLYGIMGHPWQDPDGVGVGVGAGECDGLVGGDTGMVSAAAERCADGGVGGGGFQGRPRRCLGGGGDGDGGGVNGPSAPADGRSDHAAFLDVGAIIRALRLPNEGWTLSSADASMPSPQLNGAAVRPLPYDGPGAIFGNGDDGWPVFDEGSTTVVAAGPVAGPVAAFAESPGSMTAGLSALPFSELAGGGGEAVGSALGAAAATAAAVAAAERESTVLPYIASVRPRTLLTESSRGEVRQQQQDPIAAGRYDDVRQPIGVVHLSVRVMVQAGDMPELLVRSQGRYLPVTVDYRWVAAAPTEYDSDAGGGNSTINTAIIVHGHHRQQQRPRNEVGGRDVAAAVDRSGASPYSPAVQPVLQCIVSLPAGSLPAQPGLLLVEARRAGQVLGGAAVPVLLVDDPRVAQEVQVVADTWRGPPEELDDILCDLSCFLQHVPCAIAYVEGRLGGWPTSLLAMAPGAPASVAAAVVLARVLDLGAHLLRFLETQADWPATAARLRADLTALGSVRQQPDHQPSAEAAAVVAAAPAAVGGDAHGGGAVASGAAAADGRRDGNGNRNGNRDGNGNGRSEADDDVGSGNGDGDGDGDGSGGQSQRSQTGRRGRTAAAADAAVTALSASLSPLPSEPSRSRAVVVPAPPPSTMMSPATVSMSVPSKSASQAAPPGLTSRSTPAAAVAAAEAVTEQPAAEPPQVAVRHPAVEPPQAAVRRTTYPYYAEATAMAPTLEKTSLASPPRQGRSTAAAAAAAERYCGVVQHFVRHFAELARLVLREEEELRDPGYQSFVAECAASQMHVINFVVFGVVLAVCVKALARSRLQTLPPPLQPTALQSAAAAQAPLPTTGDSPYTPYMPMIPVAAASVPYVLSAAGWLLLPRPEWVRWVHATSLWRLVSDTATRAFLLLIKSAVSPTYSSYHLGPAIWVGNIILATNNVVPTSTAIALSAARVPIDSLLSVSLGAPYGIVRVFVRSVMLSALMVIVNAFCHVLLRIWYRRRLRQRLCTADVCTATKHSKAE